MVDKVDRLDDVPHFLDMLVRLGAEGLLNADRERILSHARENNMDTGMAALELGFLEGRAAITLAALKQSELRARLVVETTNAMAESGRRQPTRLKPNWGRSDLDAPQSQRLPECAVKVANLGLNSFLLVNENCPDKAEAIMPSVVAAEKLVKAFCNSQEAAKLEPAKVRELWNKVAEGLRFAVGTSPEAPRDSQGHEIDMEAYIAARGAEITGPHEHLYNRLNNVSPVAGPLASHADRHLQGKSKSFLQAF